MEVLQARVMLVTFVGLAAAITYNAIFLQTGSHPDTMSIETKSTGARSANKVRETGVSAKTLRQAGSGAASLPRSQTILAIQRKLTEEGYAPGPVDGVFGHMTRAAIMAYQHDNGLAVTGAGTSRLLKNMIFGATAGASDPGTSLPFPAETKALVTVVQKSLTKLGYDSGPPDGIWGAATRRAIEQFERDRKLDVKGRISGRLMKELEKATGTSLALVISR